MGTDTGTGTSFQDRMQRVLAGGPGTFSKSSDRYPQGFAPEAIVAGEGAYVIGSNGRRYLDTVAALGPVILGYGHGAVTEAVTEQLQRGASFSMVHPLEVEVAELLCELIHCAEMVRFARNGTDVTNMAVRLARAYTGHRHVLFAGYHGGAMDSYGITTNRNAGIIAENAYYNHQRAWGDVSKAPGNYHVFQDLAAVVVEVPALPWGTPDETYAETLRQYQRLAQDHGSLFILDEVVTWPRADIRGAQHVYGVTPDLCTVSKAMANGLPLAALVGKRRYMERLNQGDIFASYTFAGEATGLAACKATLETLRHPASLMVLEAYGQSYGDLLQRLCSSYQLPAAVYGHPWRIQVRWHDTATATAAQLRTLWMQEHARHGVLLGIGGAFPMTCWDSKVMTHLEEAAQAACHVMRHAMDTGTVADAIQCPIISDVLSVRA